MAFIKRIIPTLFLLLGPSIIFPQCYTGLRSEGLADFRQKNYKESINKFFAARNCPDKPRGDDLDVLIKKVLTEWENQLGVALQEARTERDKAILATEEAKVQAKLALEQKEAAEHLAHASNNSALAIRTIRENPTLALRIAEFNYERYPNSEAAAVALRETLNSGKPFYKKELEGLTYVTSVTFLPDGQHFLVGSRLGFSERSTGHILELYDLEGNLVRSILKDAGTATREDEDVEDLALTADGQFILTGSYIDSIAILRKITGEVIRAFQGYDAQTVAISPDGNLVLTGGGDQTQLWDVESGTVKSTIQEGSSDDVAFSPDGKYILVRGSYSSVLRTVDGEYITELPDEGGFYMYAIHNCFSDDSQYMVTGGSTAKLWAIDGREVCAFSGNQGYVSATAFSPDGEYILGGTTKGEIFLWDTIGNMVHTFLGHKDVITSVDFSPDGNYFLSGSSDLTVKLWSWNKGTGKTLAWGEEAVNKVAFHPNGNQILCSYLDGHIAKWNRESGTLEDYFKGNDYFLSAGITFSPSGKYLMASTEDSTSVLWDMNTKSKVHTFEGHGSIAGFPSNVMAVAFSQKEDKALTASSDRTVILWDLKTKEKLLTISPGEGGLYDVGFTPDDQIVFCAKDRTLKRYDQNGTLLQNYKGHLDWINCLDISPDGQYLVSGSTDGKIILHHIDGTILQTFFVPDEFIMDVVFSPDGKYILSGSTDFKARLWDFNGLEIQVFEGHEGIVNSVDFSPDGRHVVTGSDDGTIRIWPLKDALIEESVAKLKLSTLLKAGMTISDEDFLGLARQIEEAQELLALYRYGREERPKVDLLSLIMESEKEATQVHHFIELLDSDALGLSRENFGNLLEALRGNYDNLVLIYEDIARLIDHSLSLEDNPTHYEKYAQYINDYAWYQLLVGDFMRAEKAVRRGLELSPYNPYLLGNLPTALLFQGKYAEAEELIKKHAAAPFASDSGYKNFAAAFIADFNVLDSRGVIPEAHRAKMEAILSTLQEFVE